jgi:hypothetical protein
MTDITSMSQGYILYLEPFQTIVCRECQFGITKGGLRLHFRRHHKSIPIKVRRELENHVENFSIADLKDISVPMTEVNMIEGLKVQEGWICTSKGCGMLYASLIGMMIHCRKAHKWVKSKGTRLYH